MSLSFLTQLYYAQIFEAQKDLKKKIKKIGDFYCLHPLGLPISTLSSKILTAVDKNCKGKVRAVIATLVDWKQAFPHQCPKLGVEAFISMGIRPSLIPMLLTIFRIENEGKREGNIFSSKENTWWWPTGGNIWCFRIFSPEQ